VSLSTNRIPPNANEARITLQTAVQKRNEVIGLAIEGTAVIGVKETTHIAIPADEMMQAFFYKHLVPAKDLELAVSDRGEFRKAAGERRNLKSKP
jgi:hypothetical protein